MSKNYNPEMPSTGYDVADLAALKASNLMPALKEDRLCRFDSTDDASIFFATTSSLSPTTRFIRSSLL